MQKFPVCYEVFYRSANSRQSSVYQDRQLSNQLNQEVIRSVSKFGNDIICSLRYLHSPNQKSKIRTFILLNCTSESYSLELIDRVKNYFEKGNISSYFIFSLHKDISHIFGLSWVNYIGEIVKSEEFITSDNIYLVHEFEAKPDHDFNAVLEVINHIDKDLILEITIQSYSKSLGQTKHISAIDEVLDGLRLAINEKDCSLHFKQTLNTYEKYKNAHLNEDCLKYNIKVLSTSSGDAQLVLDTLIDCLTLQDRLIKQGRILCISQENERFNRSKRASINVEITELPVWEGWQKQIGDTFISKTLNTPKERGFLALGDGSLSCSNLQMNNELSQYDSSITSNSSFLSESASQSIACQIKDLDRLYKLVTLQEISTFFKITALNSLIPTSDFNNLFNKYKDLITANRYIVGISDQGKVIMSDWDTIPHRLIAGVTRSGKSNFINWIIFQFLYANPDGKIYITDFKGADFSFLTSYFGNNVDIVNTVEDCQSQLERIEIDEYIYRRDLINKHGVQNINQLQREGINISRTLWIVDEAADIADAPSRIKEPIEKSLKKYARQGSAFGIHLIYSTQRPTPEVITKQVTDQCEEKTIFRVSVDASQRIILCDDAGEISEKNRGRAILQQGPDDKTAVNTPSIQVPIGTQIRLEDTLWVNINTTQRGKL